MDSWTLLDRSHLGNFRVFDVFRHLLKSPETGEAHDFYVIDAPDWVNVIPITSDRKVVCVRQYRAGTDTVTLEIPGGMMDPGDEDPVAAAVREMREETGYVAERYESLGDVAPNPAIQSNRCYTICAWDAYRDGPQALDGTEVIDIELVDLDAIPSLIVNGRITNSLVVAAFYLLDRSREPSAT
ncbi:NUDIX hydrolase [Longibacter salinarum]|uniref:NUDIX hydrolase n=1 Tax=Longibacter salinarum TaxID=1850348 RepID=UPI001FE3D16D|nr:NUDIX hydrolase [Longibacter salinarum]